MVIFLCSNQLELVLFAETYLFCGDPKYNFTKSEFSNGKGIFWCKVVFDMISTNSSEVQKTFYNHYTTIYFQCLC